MKKIDLGQSITILANVGVIAGIVFLGIELRQNNELLTAQASYAQFNVERERRERLMVNADGFTDLVVKARTDAPLTETEWTRVNVLFNDILDSWRWQYRELQAGRLPDNFVDLRVWRAIWDATPGVRDLFRDNRNELDPGFVEFVEGNVISR